MLFSYIIPGLLAEDFSTGDLSARIREFVSENEESPAQIQKKTKPDLPPFPELRYLNLADNKVGIRFLSRYEKQKKNLSMF